MMQFVKIFRKNFAHVAVRQFHRKLVALRQHAEVIERNRVKTFFEKLRHVEFRGQEVVIIRNGVAHEELIDEIFRIFGIRAGNAPHPG